MIFFPRSRRVFRPAVPLLKKELGLLLALFRSQGNQKFFRFLLRLWVAQTRSHRNEFNDLCYFHDTDDKTPASFTLLSPPIIGELILLKKWFENGEQYRRQGQQHGDYCRPCRHFSFVLCHPCFHFSFLLFANRRIILLNKELLIISNFSP